MNYYDLYECDTRNSKGFSVTLSVAGCNMNPKCEGCFASHTWDFNCGQPFTKDTEDLIIKYLSKPYIKWFSIIGGNPTDNLKDGILTGLVKRIKKELPHIFIACWSGDIYENLIKRDDIKDFFNYIDMLRDGRFIPKLKDKKQFLQGSKNQRYINVQTSIKKNKVIEFEEFKGDDLNATKRNTRLS